MSTLWKYLTSKKPAPPASAEPKPEPNTEPPPRDMKVYVEITAADRLDFIQRTGRILDDEAIDALLLRDDAYVRPRLVDELVRCATQTQSFSYGSYAAPDLERIAQLRDLLLYGKLPPHGKKVKP